MSIAQALAVHRQGKLAEAEDLYAEILRLRPGDFDAMHLLGVVYLQSNRTAQGVELIKRAICLNPNVADAFNNLGNGLRVLRRLNEALANYDQAIALSPRHADAFNNRALALWDLSRLEETLAPPIKPQPATSPPPKLARLEEALQSFDKAIELNGNFVDAHKNRSTILLELARPADALISIERAIVLNPKSAELFNGLGAIFLRLKRPADALMSFDKSIKLKSDFADAHNNRGVALLDLDRLNDALESFQTAVTLKPDFADAQRNHGDVLAMLNRYGEAFAVYDRLFVSHPDLVGLEGDRLNVKMKLCDWTNFESDWQHLIASIRSDRPNSQPFYFLSGPSSAADQLQCSQLWAAHHFPCQDKQSVTGGQRHHHERIRVAYVSADFREHPLSYLAAGLFECHDRSMFETTAIAIGPGDNSEIRRRLKSSFEHFIDARIYTDEQIAGLIRERNIDILVDLMGFTTSSRTKVFSLRPAPVQVSYLGYPGTMGASYIDYMIADKIVIPKDQRRWYAESIVFLPDSYLVNDRKRQISSTAYSRTVLGLPASGFVFCCFNNNYKITPGMFDVWMRILKRVPDSVLWLYENGPDAAANLSREATTRGVDAKRIIFAKQMPVAEHLARLRLANLCLDTLPYNSHTTASDTLWAGTPLITCVGDSFVGKVAASALYALRMPELVTKTLEEYEELAVKLATHSDRLSEINRKLRDCRLRAPLFDTKQFTRNFELALHEMIARQRANLSPTDIYLSRSRPA